MELRKRSNILNSREESFLDVGGPSTAESIGENLFQNILHDAYTSEPELNENIHLDQPKDVCHTWVPCEKKQLLKIISSLRKIIRVEHFYSSQVNPLLKVLNSMLQERYADDTAVDQFLSSLHLSDDDVDKPRETTKQDSVSSLFYII
ncbi:unnamed protein product [Trichobilharzia regenti]|nr:unnamed protein product [Trichobilharzia regenti]